MDLSKKPVCICACVIAWKYQGNTSARGQTKPLSAKPDPRSSPIWLIYEAKTALREGERSAGEGRKFSLTLKSKATQKPKRDLSEFELYQGLRLINTLLEKELITKAE